MENYSSVSIYSFPEYQAVLLQDQIYGPVYWELLRRESYMKGDATAVLTAERIGHRFGQRVLFRNVSLLVSGGNMLAVTGPNGSGKSTMIQILAGLMRPVAGKVSLNVAGKVIPPDQHLFHTGFVAPYLGVYEELTALENIKFVADVRGLPSDRERILEVLDSVEMASRGDDQVNTFSSGMKQRLRIALAILADPSVLFLDEPTVNLDAPGKDLSKKIVEGFLSRGKVVVVASNAPEEYQSANQVINIPDHA